MPTPRANIRDVAREAGVSLTTVSLVLNAKDQRISSATRERVHEAMRRLSYTPSRLARGLPSRRSRTIAVLCPDLHGAARDPAFGAMLAGVHEAARARGYRVLIERADESFIARGEHRTMLDDCTVDGVVFIGARPAREEHANDAPGTAWISELEERGEAVRVIRARDVPMNEADALRADADGGRDACARLIDRLENRKAT